MTEDEALQLKPGDKITVLDGTGRIATVARISNEPFEHTHIWLEETGRFLIPGQVSPYRKAVC
jgi:hypothetical protein